VSEPSIYYCNNVYGSLRLLETMRRTGMDKMILSSTCATYGDPQHLPMTESHPQNPTNPYGASKLMVERMLRDFEGAYGIHSISLRYFSAAGADPMGEIGEEHEPETHVIPLAIRAAPSGQEPLTVFGTDYPTAMRDYVHIEDLADAHHAACKHLLSGGGNISMNLGTGRGHSVLEVIAAVERVCGRAVPVRYESCPSGDPPALVADAAMARATLGWQPRFTEIEPIVRTAWDRHRRQIIAAVS
jgi:UDP-arabinose 4-epimerase